MVSRFKEEVGKFVKKYGLTPTIDFRSESDALYFVLHSEDDEGDIDSFQSFLTDLVGFLVPKLGEIEKYLKSACARYGFVDLSSRLVNRINDLNLDNFKVKLDRNDDGILVLKVYLFDAERNRTGLDLGFVGGENVNYISEDVHQKLLRELRAVVKDYLSRLERSASNQRSFWSEGVEDVRKSVEHSMEDPDNLFLSVVHGRLVLFLKFVVSVVDEEEQVQRALDFIEILDKNTDKLAEVGIKVFQEVSSIGSV